MSIAMSVTQAANVEEKKKKKQGEAHIAYLG
jgi:hypothetical protein